MTTLIGISGSLRQASINTALLRHAAGCAPDGSQIVIESLADIPLYNGDVEADSGVPKAATDLKDNLAAADGLLISTPEYNNAMPGVLKNAIDWMSRPGSDIPRVFGGKPVAVMGASPGAFGTRLGQTSLWPVLRVLGTNVWFGGRLEVQHAGKVFDDSGTVVDDEIAERVQTFIDGFFAFVRTNS